MKSAVAFEKASYLAQVRRLRRLAKKGLELYPFKVRKLEFIHHGENATFLVRTVQGEKFLLRILRADYHTTPAVLEELKWLTSLSKKGITAPRPVLSRRGRLLESAETTEIPAGRRFCVFKWIDGRFVSKAVRSDLMYEIGALLARLQKTAPKTRHRRYWDAEGLVGKNPKFGSTHALPGITKATQRTISRVRPRVFAKLRDYQRRFPKRLGYIHADLHFGNLLKTPNGVAAIDFDDSGYGFYVYDLIVPYMSAQHLLGKRRPRELESLKSALIAGYASEAHWDNHDESIFDHLVAARKITMLGWLSSRSENPRLKAHLAKSAKSAASYLKTRYKV